MTPRVSEKQEQASIVQLVETLGGKAYVLGTTRPAGDFRGTCQTPGLPDLYAFLPYQHAASTSRASLWIEVKKVGGRRSKAQDEFKALCEASDTRYLCGTCDDVIAWLKEAGWLK